MILGKLRKKGKKEEEIGVQKAKEYKAVNKDNYQSFLKEVGEAVDLTFAGQDSVLLEQAVKQELDYWLKNTIFAGKELDPPSLKLGICLGIREALRKVNEAEEIPRVSYIQ